MAQIYTSWRSGAGAYSYNGAAAPELVPRTWSAMSAYAKDDIILCLFQSSREFKTMYATLGFSDEANVDDGTRLTAFALATLTAADDRAGIGALVKRATA